MINPYEIGYKMVRNVKIILISLLSIALCSCAPTQVNYYDEKFLELIKRANNGDVNAAREAHIHCGAVLKLEDYDLPSSFIGQCGGALALWMNLALESGDPAKIDDALNNGAFNYKDVANHRNYYLKIAKMTISERCMGSSPASSCSDPVLLEKFGLSGFGAKQ